jgi:hypothetical protein
VQAHRSSPLLSPLTCPHSQTTRIPLPLVPSPALDALRHPCSVGLYLPFPIHSSPCFFLGTHNHLDGQARACFPRCSSALRQCSASHAFSLELVKSKSTPSCTPIASPPNIPLRRPRFALRSLRVPLGRPRLSPRAFRDGPSVPLSPVHPPDRPLPRQAFRRCVHINIDCGREFDTDATPDAAARVSTGRVQIARQICFGR